jgi:hypothetical protein
MSRALSARGDLATALASTSCLGISHCASTPTETAFVTIVGTEELLERDGESQKSQEDGQRCASKDSFRSQTSSASRGAASKRDEVAGARA